MDYLSAEEEVYILKRISFYKSLGIVLWLEGEKLKFRIDGKKMTEEWLSMLKKDKELLVKFYKHDSDREKAYFDLTPIQAAYVNGGETGYELGNTNAHYYVEYEMESVDEKKLEKAINQVIEDHDALRLVVNMDRKQRVLKKVPKFNLEIIKLNADGDLSDIRNKWSHHIYELGVWPMFNFVLSTFDNEHYTFHVSFDCILMDAWSASMMLDEIFAIYDGEEINKVNYSFEDYMRAIEKLDLNQMNAKAKAYWDEQIKTMPLGPKLKYECSFGDIDKMFYKRLQYTFSTEETMKFYERLKKLYITPSAAMCTIFMKVMSYFSENKDITIDLTLFNRHPVSKEINQVLGDFTNVGFASYIHKDNLKFSEELKLVSGQFWKLVEFHSYDGTKVLKELAKKMPGKAVMPVVFTSVLQGMQKDENNMRYKEKYAISQTPQTIIDHQLRDDRGGLSLSWDYIVDLFDEKYIEKMFNTYISLTRKIMSLDDWNQCISINEDER